MKKRFLSILLCICMVLTLTPTMAFAAETSPAEVIEAPLVDHRTDDRKVPDDEITFPNSYKVTAGASTTSDQTTTVPVTVKAKDLRKHQNDKNQMAYWVGIGIKHQDNVTFACDFGNYPETAPDFDDSKDGQTTENGNTYDTFYFNADHKYTEGQKKNKGYVAVKANDNKIAVYDITFDVTLAKSELKAVHFKADAQEANKGAGITDAIANTMWVEYTVPIGTAGYWMEVSKDGETDVLHASEYSDFDPAGENGKKTEWRKNAWSFENNKQTPNLDIEAGTYTVSLSSYTGTLDSVNWEDSKKNGKITTTNINEKEITLAKVTFAKGESDNDLVNAKDQWLDIDDTDVKITLPNEPKKNNYKFKGWSCDKEKTVYADATAVKAAVNEGKNYTFEPVFEKIVIDPESAVANIKPPTPTVAETLTAVVNNDNVETTSPEGTITLNGTLKQPGADGTKVELHYNTTDNKESDITQTITLKYGTSGTGSNAGKWTVNVDSGNTATFVESGITYTVEVGDITIIPENVEVSGGEPVTTVSDQISEADRTNVETALKNSDSNLDAMMKGGTVQTAVKNELENLTEKKVNDYLAKANEGVSGSTYNTVDVVVYLDIEAKNYNSDSNNKSLTVDITPMMKLVAKGESGTKPKDISGTEKELSGSDISEKVEITIGLPDGFVTYANGGYPDVYVDHKGHVVTGTVTNKTSDQTGKNLIATFTNTDGFSPFVITAENPAVAEIGNETYSSLQAAVDAITGDSAKIELLKKPTAATVSKEVTIILKADSSYSKADDEITSDEAKKLLTAGKRFKLAEGSPTGTSLTDINGLTFIFVEDEDYVEPTPGGSSGSSSGTSATVTTSSTTNGSFTVSDRYASAGKTVTITPKPNDGYIVDTVKVTDKNGDSIKVTKNADGTYSFVMPEKSAQPVKVEVTFKEDDGTGDHPSAKFTDVVSGAWYQTAVDYVIANGLMEGTSDTTFEPNTTTSRGMVVTILYRLEGTPSAASSGFPDVAAGQWYTDAVSWAATNGIVTGYDNGNFGPNDMITREQMATILYRYASHKAYGTGAQANLASYTDASAISAYAESAMKWANAEGLITGTTATTLSPAGDASRAEVATILMRFCEEVVK